MSELTSFGICLAKLYSSNILKKKINNTNNNNNNKQWS